MDGGATERRRRTDERKDDEEGRGSKETLPNEKTVQFEQHFRLIGLVHRPIMIGHLGLVQRPNMKSSVLEHY